MTADPYPPVRILRTQGLTSSPKPSMPTSHVTRKPLYLKAGHYDWDYLMGHKGQSLGLVKHRNLRLNQGTYTWDCYLKPGSGTYTGRCTLKLGSGTAVLNTGAFHVPSGGQWTWGAELHRTGS